MNQAPTLFLCYAREDKSAVEDIYIQLKQAGLAPWMDKPPHPYSMEGLQPGEKWDSKIREAIRKADYFLAFLSPVSVLKRGFVQREYRLALDRMNELPEESVFVIPVLLAECVPPAITVGQVSFRDVHWYELYNRGVDDLIKYVRNFAELKKKEHVDLGKRLVIDFGTSSTAVAVASDWKSETIPVLDLGGGTTDISMHQLVSRLLAVLTPSPKIEDQRGSADREDLLLPTEIAERLVYRASNSSAELGGALFGARTLGGWAVTEATEGFDLVASLKDAQSDRIIGMWHTHPGARNTFLSVHDEKVLRDLRLQVSLVVSPAAQGGPLAAFAIRNGRLTLVPIVQI